VLLAGSLVALPALGRTAAGQEPAAAAQPAATQGSAPASAAELA
jgi:hypothetical protein